MKRSTLAVHAFLPDSRANGPGARAVIWVQGCTLACPGCFNPLTHPVVGGETVETADLAARVVACADRIEGVTITGGEPLQQADAVLDLLQRVRRARDLGVVLFTGHTWSEILAVPERAALLAYVDVIVAGRYVDARRLGHGLRGSDNQTVHHVTDRYRPGDLAAAPEAEVVVEADGTVVLSGIDPPLW